MPLFAYVCGKCGAQMEMLVRGGEKPACPECGARALEKQLSHIQPLRGGRAPEAAGCGMTNCCQMQGGGCMN
jgi:putative FmdB family regulatory protein